MNSYWNKQGKYIQSNPPIETEIRIEINTFYKYLDPFIASHLIPAL